MLRTCPNCARTVADAGPGGFASFCMYCGQKLPLSTRPPEPAPESAVLTRSFLPADADTPRSGPDSADVLTRSLFALPNQPPTGRSNPAGPPSEIGGYKIVRQIGAGGMGAVYEAIAADGATRVAVKLLSGRLADNPVSVERFKQEGRVASQIAHPRCVFVLGADTDAGRPYIVMELMPGTTLKDLVDRRGLLPPAEAVARVLDVIDGLTEAHRLGVIHRDVKPSNCFLTSDDRVKIGDFGLSKSLAGDRDGGQLTQTGAFLGTVLFASPEQIRGEPVGYESDVYSVCATLYYLLAGRAPHQHTSLTGALAKAISEPPTPLRAIRPNIPVRLDRVILRGLERERARRWQTLPDLRDALRDQLPATHTNARRRVLAMAYLADFLLLQFVIVPLQMLTEPDTRVGPFAGEVVSFAVMVAYFAAAEGVFGTTVGKQLLRLRVARVGETGPPGVPLALARAAIFHLMLFGATTGFAVALDRDLPPTLRLVGMGLLAVGLPALAFQWKRTPAGFRGLHDRATGCHTLQRPRPPDRVRLVSRFPNPLDAAKRPGGPFPALIGGYAVVGKICDLLDGGEVWVGEDKSLGRRVVIRLSAPGSNVLGANDPATPRPCRLRSVGNGEFAWEGTTRGWSASVAPAGAPLPDVIDPARPLDWADARPLMEQVVDEMIAGESDGSWVERPNVGQVWVEPGGQVQLLDVPLPTGAALAVGPARPPRPGPTDPLVFVREVATLLLEGKARSTGGPVRAAVPPHAAAVTTRLFGTGPDGYVDLAGLRSDLTDTHAHPPRVSRPARAAHLGVQAAMLSVGLVVMFAVSGLFSWGLAAFALTEEWAPHATRAALADPAARSVLLAKARETLPADDPARKALEEALTPDRLPDTLARLDAYAASEAAAPAAQRAFLTGPETKLLDRFGRMLAAEKAVPPATPEAVRATAMYLLAVRSNPPPAVPASDVRRAMAEPAAAAVVAVPLMWGAFAFVFRGGLAMSLAGITIVRTNGRPANRFLCVVRELLVWLPVTALLLAALWVQVAAPQYVAVRSAIWFAAVVLLPVYVLTALRYPSRPPHDRLMGTVLVPV